MTKTKKFTDDDAEEYNSQHVKCPKCLSLEVEQKTSIAFSDPRKNPNKQYCLKCGWIGFEFQMLSEETIIPTA